MSLKNKEYALLILGLITVFLVGLKLGRGTSTLNIFVIEYVIFAYLGVIVFVIYSMRLRKKELSSIDILSREHIKVLDVAFIVFFSLIIYSLRDALYVKPLLYYILVSLASTALGIQILFSKEITKRQSTKILIQILSLAIIIRFSSSMINPYFTGLDSYWHYHIITNLISSGKLNPLAHHYYYYPFFHLINTISSVLVLFSKNILVLISLIMGTLAVLIMYYIGKEISNEKTGLIGALLLTLSTLHIYRSSGLARPEVTFILLCILAIIKASDYGLSRAWVVFWISALAVFFIHPTATIVLAGILAANFIIKNLQSHFKEKNNKIRITPFVSYSIGFIAYLEFVHYSLFVDMVNILFAPEEEVAPLITTLVPATKKTITYLYHLEAYLAFFGISVIVSLAFIGGLKWVRGYDLTKLTIILGIILIYLIPVYSVARGFYDAQPSRFLLHGNILMIIPAATGLIMLFETIEGKNQKILFGIILLLIFSFFSITSHLAGDGNGLLNGELPFVQRHETQSGIAIYPFTKKIGLKDTLFIDDEIRKFMYGSERGIIDTSRDNLEPLSRYTVDKEGFFIVDIPKLDGGYIGGVKLGKEFLDKFREDEKVYDNGNVQIFEK